MIAKKEIAQLPVLTVKAQGRDQYIGRIQMYRETLVLDVYDARRVICPEGEEKTAEIQFRWVCDKKNYYVYRFLTGTWTDCGLNYVIHGLAWYSSSLPIKLDEASKTIAETFLEDCKDRMMHCYSMKQIDRLNALEEYIRNKRRDRYEQNRSARISARQKLRKALPKDWERWLKTNVYEDKRYLFYNARSRRSGTCAYCGNAVALDGKQRHKIGRAHV